MSRRLVVEADGGSRGNPGPAGFGALVRDADTGEVLAERTGYLGVTTNNVAEYQGLLAGLAAAAELDPASVEVRMDSRLVIEQTSGRWQVRHPGLRPLAREAIRRIAALPAVTLTWVPRERNAAADRLANQAMDAGARAGSPNPPAPPQAAPPAPPQATPPAPGDDGPNRLAGWMAPTGPPTTLLLLRHGETPLSVQRRFAGRTDTPLSPHGQAQAAAAAQALASRGRVDAVVASPLRRAQATAAVCARALGLPVSTVADLRETDFGDWEGLTFAEARARGPAELQAWLDDPAVAPPGGESFLDTQHRVLPALAGLLAAWPGATVLVVTHVTPVKLAVRDALLAPMAALYRLHLDTCGLSVLDCYPDGPRVLRAFNDTHHLDGLTP